MMNYQGAPFFPDCGGMAASGEGFFCAPDEQLNSAVSASPAETQSFNDRLETLQNAVQCVASLCENMKQAVPNPAPAHDTSNASSNFECMVAELRGELDENRKEMVEMREIAKKNSDLECVVAELRGELDENRKAMDEMRENANKTSELECVVAELRGELDENRKAMDEMRENANKTSELERVVAELRGKLDENRKAMDEMRGEILESFSRLEHNCRLRAMKWKNKASEFEKRVDALEVRADASSAVSADAEERLKSLVSRVDAIEAELKGKDGDEVKPENSMAGILERLSDLETDMYGEDDPQDPTQGLFERVRVIRYDLYGTEQDSENSFFSKVEKMERDLYGEQQQQQSEGRVQGIVGAVNSMQIELYGNSAMQLPGITSWIMHTDQRLAVFNQKISATVCKENISQLQCDLSACQKDLKTLDDKMGDALAHVADNQMRFDEMVSKLKSDAASVSG